MLEERSPEWDESDSMNKEVTTLEEEFLVMLEERSPEWDDCELIKEEDTSLEEEFSEMLEERSPEWDESESMNEEVTSLEEEFSAKLEERSSVRNESESIKEEDTSLEEEFSAMLEERSSVRDESESIKEEDTSLEEEFSEMLEERTFILDETESIKEGDSSLEEEFSEMLEERTFILDETESIKEEDNSLEEEFSTMLEGRSPEWDKSDSNKEKTTSLEEEFSMKLEETSSVLDEFAPTTEEVSSLQNESFSVQDEFIEDATSSLNRFDSLLDKFSLMLEDEHEHASSQDGFERELLKEENREDEYCKTPLKQNCSQKSHLPIVKLPVLLAKLNIDIDMFNSLELSLPIANITKIEWSIDSLECRVLLPSTTVFLKGILIADIQYVNENLTHTLHTVKVPVPWEKIITINWLYPPVLSSSSQREFMFGSHDAEEVSSHYEYCQQITDQIEYSLRSINFVWHDEVGSQAETPKVSIQGRANLAIDLLQQQYIDLNSAGSFH
jgi:myosin heavy subunit